MQEELWDPDIHVQEEHNIESCNESSDEFFDIPGIYIQKPDHIILYYFPKLEMNATCTVPDAAATSSSESELDIDDFDEVHCYNNIL